MLPPSASTFAGDIDWLYYFILVITGVAFVVVEVALIWFLWKYRARPGHLAYHTHGNFKAEVIWTAVPAIVVVLIGVLSAGVWADVNRSADEMPPNALPVRIMGKQFEWLATYPGADGQLGTADDHTTRNALHVPVGRPIAITLEAEDVIHSFFVPAFRVKQDAVPGMRIPVWFEATTPGQYEIACAELCGFGHYSMRSMVTVYTQADYDSWLAQARAAALIR
jgi:cytochrome c oxidase subunit 2